MPEIRKSINEVKTLDFRTQDTCLNKGRSWDRLKLKQQAKEVEIKE